MMKRIRTFTLLRVMVIVLALLLVCVVLEYFLSKI